jgi:hypothetical protein
MLQNVLQTSMVVMLLRDVLIYVTNLISRNDVKMILSPLLKNIAPDNVTNFSNEFYIEIKKGKVTSKVAPVLN